MCLRFAGGAAGILLPLLIATAATAQSSDMFVTKTSPASANVGTNVTFTITVGNAGPDDAPSAGFTDTLPPGGNFVSATQTSGPSFPPCTTPAVNAPGGTVTCTIAVLATGASAMFDIVVNVSAGAAGTTLINTVSAFSGNPDDNSENNTSASGTSVPGGNLADVGITKTGPGSAPPNTDVTYTITVTNFGANDAQTVSWTDTLPSSVPPGFQMTFVSLNQNSGPAFSCNVVTNTVTCTIGTLAVNATATFTLVGHIPNGTSGTLFTNIATVTSANDPNPDNNSSATSLFVLSADVGVTKSAPATAVAGGPTYDYIVTLSNGGPDTANDASFTDALPAGLAFVSITQNTGALAACTTPGSGSGGTVSCTIPQLLNGQSAQFTITVQPLPTIPNGTVLSNTATASTSSADTNSSNNSSTASTTITTLADVSITKSGPATATAGSNITYAITVTNSGPSNAANVAWTDVLPANTTFVSEVQNTGPTFTCTTGATVSCSIASLAPGTTATFTLTVKLFPATTSGTTISDTATVTSTTADSTSGNNSSTSSASVSTSADVSVAKTGPDSVAAGSTATYTLTVANAGPSDASTVSLTDTLPPGTTFASFSQTTGPAFTCSTPSAGGTGTITCNIATLASGASATFSLVLNVSPSTTGTLSNTATVSATTPDPNSANNSSTKTTTVGVSADVSVTKTGPAAVPVGTNVTYTVTVSNPGPAVAASVSLTDAVPAGTTFVSETQTTGPAFTCATPAAGATGTITCTIATLSAGASATFSIVVNVSSGTTGTITNTATVSSSTSDPNPANNSARAMTTASPVAADLSIVKTASAPTAGSVTFTIVVTNNGPAVGQNVVMTDVLPAGTTFTSVATTQGSCTSGSTVTCALGTLPVGSSATITLVVTLQSNAAVSNTATVAGSSPDPNPANNSSTVAVGAATIPTLSPPTFALLALVLIVAGFWVLRRQRPASTR